MRMFIRVVCELFYRLFSRIRKANLVVQNYSTAHISGISSDKEEAIEMWLGFSHNGLEVSNRIKLYIYEKSRITINFRRGTHVVFDEVVLYKGPKQFSGIYDIRPVAEYTLASWLYLSLRYVPYQSCLVYVEDYHPPVGLEVADDGKY